MTAEQVARPVHAIERPASMAMLVKTARALKVLHGPCRMTEVGPKFVFWTDGERCYCRECDDYLRKLARLDWITYPSGMIVCSTCGNKRCPHATDHDEDCTGSNAPGQPGSAYSQQTPPPGSVRAYLDRRRKPIGPEDWPTETELRDDLTRPKTGDA